MSATPPAPAPEKRPRPAAAWLAFSARMTAQVAPAAGRPDLTVTVAPRSRPGSTRLLHPGQRRDRGQRRVPARRPGHGRPRQPGRPGALPGLVGATVHECAHAAHSRWRAPKGTDAAWSAAAAHVDQLLVHGDLDGLGGPREIPVHR